MGVNTADYRHAEEKRTNIPQAKIAGEGRVPKVEKARLRYQSATLSRALDAPWESPYPRQDLWAYPAQEAGEFTGGPQQQGGKFWILLGDVTAVD